jgi:hypothetical protein
MVRWPFIQPDSRSLVVPEAAAPAADGGTAEALLDRIAGEVVRRGMVTPAVFFIELNRPLSFLAGQAAHVLFPFLAPLLGVTLARQLAELLEDPANVDRLLGKIERLAVGDQRSTISSRNANDDAGRSQPKAND